MLDPDVVFLNHGSFGSCPREVLQYQQSLRDRLERQPVTFYVRDLEQMLDDARTELAAFVNCEAKDLAWLPNITTGVNAVVQSLKFSPGDELLVTNHEYNACRNVLEFVAQRDKAKVLAVNVPFPTTGLSEIHDVIMSRVTDQTRIALLDHVTSQTGLIMPLETLIPAMRERGVQTLVDGAHAPGMIDVDITGLGADYYSANCHKWICAPKGAGFLHVKPEHQENVRPPVISHGANSRRTDRSRYLVEFDWPGTWDPTAVLSVPVALKTLESYLPGGWPAIRKHNNQTVIAGRRLLCTALEIDAPCPDEMLGSLASLPLPDSDGPASTSALYGDPLQAELLQRWNIEVPLIPWPAHPKRLIRISAQLYNGITHYERLAGALRELFPQAA
ncbi:MAG: aminotransferase class V-fold PLP-dependent enzyme [Gammaproteobacteria bacterium]|nr:aminotransferase class V-fold PLP-dependent enzyme [Gammaproteobacteria bacterium]MDH3766832.1 aminotransferase class V-fold PLP-dependent enzyme [Gammaproteobacteria bacterium]